MMDDSYIFERYLDGLLDEDALIQFENKLRENPDFANRFELYKRMDDMMRRFHGHVFGVKKLYEDDKVPDLKELNSLEEDINEYYRSKKNISAESEHLKNRLENIYQEYHQLNHRKIRKSALLGIAASLAILVSLSVLLPHSFYGGKTSAEVYMQNYMAYPTVFNKRGANDERSMMWADAVKKYQAKDYTSALTAFKAFSDFQKRNDIADLYCGICYMELADFVKARTILLNLSERKGSLVQDQALWYLGLVYLKMDDRIQAIKSFQKISENGSEFHLKAVKIIKVLQ